VHGRAGEIVKLIDDARANGVQVWADQYPYNFAGGGLANDLLPPWVVAGGFGPRVARLSDPEQLPNIRREMVVNLRRAGGADNIVIRDYRPDESLIGQRLSAIARARGQEPVDLIVDLLKKGDAGMMQFNMTEPDVELFMQQPWTMTSTDGTLPEFGQGGAHPRSYGSFVRKLRKYAIDKPVITLEQAIHRSSGLTATVLGIQDRGYLRSGAYADVLVINPSTLRERSTYQQPHAYCEGMDWILVNGRAAIANGKLTAERHGRVLRRHRQ
jgi:N-acyl-D-aspartate/D-glutamate deacylase